MRGRALNLFASTKMILLCFIEQAKRLKRRRRRARAEGDAKEQRGEGPILTPPPPPQSKTHTHTQDLWLVAQSQGSKGRGKVSFVPSVHSVLKRSCKQPQKHTETHIRAHTHTHGLVFLKVTSDLWLCSTNQRNGGRPSTRFPTVEKLLRGPGLVWLLLQAVQRLVTDSSNNQ